MTMVKQQGALLAKGRLLGIQFDVLFTDDLYQTISKNAIETAAVLKKGLAEKGYSFFMDSPTNQVFIVLSNEQLAALEARPSSASGRSTMIPTPLSALPPAGPPGWKRWSSCWS